MDGIDGVENETLRLLIQLQLDDLDSLQHTGDTGPGKGKRRDDSNVEASLSTAIDLYRAELTRHAQILADSAMCASMARAVDADSGIIRAAVRLENQAIQDRCLATALSRGENIPADNTGSSRQRPSKTPSVSVPPQSLNPSWQPQAATSTPSEASIPPAESSTWASSRQQPRRKPTSAITKKPCVACGEAVPQDDVLTCPPPCNHGYCRACLENLFKAAMTDESLFPPRCCSEPISIEIAGRHLPRSVINDFLEKRVEFETPNRTYCHRPTCSAFIRSESIFRTVATCTKCGNRTCTICKGRSHPGQTECPEDPSARQMAEIATQNGWQKCKPCGRYIELDTGCNHISKLTFSFFAAETMSPLVY